MPFTLFQGDALCKDCFYYAFEEEIHKTIIDAKLFSSGETVAIGASGGKGTCTCIFLKSEKSKSCSVILFIFSN